MKKIFASLVLVLVLVDAMGLNAGYAALVENKEQPTAQEAWRGPTVNSPGTFGNYDPATGDRTSPYAPYHHPDR